MADAGHVDEDSHIPATKLTFEQAVAHIGGADKLVSDHGRFLIKANVKNYLWKYPDKVTHCTACGGAVEGFIGQHGRYYACPKCGARAEFRYAAKGHGRCYDEFYLYEWRRSELDAETIVLTGAIVYRDSTKEQPHDAPLHVDPNAIYVFKSGKPTTVYKQRWFWGADRGEWTLQKGAYPEHTRYRQKPLDIVIDRLEFRKAIEGTQIGRLFDLLREESGRWEDLELKAIDGCARRTWLEYLFKAGQRALAAELMRVERVEREVVPNVRARKPQELLGLTEAQWFETRRDKIQLTRSTLRVLRALERLDIGPMKVAKARELAARGDAEWYIDGYIAPATRGAGPRICDRLAKMPERVRRKILRKILADPRRANDWKDYYDQLARLGEVEMDGDAFRADADLPLIMPKDVERMHQRMNDRENAIKAEKRARELAKHQPELEARLEKLRKDYTFQACGLILRPYESVEEVVREGQRLHICIGSYAERYAEGGTIICCLRKAEAPDVSWRAVEFSAKTGKKVQDRGAHNDCRGGVPEDVAALLKQFWAAWDERHDKRERSSVA